MTVSRPSRPARRTAVTVGGETVRPGESRKIDLPVALLPTHTQLHLPVSVLHGRRAGPSLWVSAAIHGDELNGVEIIRRVLENLDPGKLAGTLYAVPIVNVFGFIQQSRYLPDRRDLNRSFPGSARGSLAGRIAHLFLGEIVHRCDFGLDLHTASTERDNHPQVRGNLRDPGTLRIARAFRAPFMVQSVVRDGSLRAVATKRGIPALTYEGGEPLRFNPGAIDAGVDGIRGVMHELGMLRATRRRRSPESILVPESQWIRARRGGLLRLSVDCGDRVSARQQLGVIADPLGDERVLVRAPFDGVVLGLTRNPVVHGGDAVVHLGKVVADD